MIPLGFPPCSKWRIVAPLAVLFSLRAIIAVTWHEWGIATASEVRIGGHQMRLVHHSQGWVSSSDYQRNGKADRYGIRGQLDSHEPLAKLGRLDSRTTSHVDTSHVLISR